MTVRSPRSTVLGGGEGADELRVVGGRGSGGARQASSPPGAED